MWNKFFERENATYAKKYHILFINNILNKILTISWKNGINIPQAVGTCRNPLKKQAFGRATWYRFVLDGRLPVFFLRIFRKKRAPEGGTDKIFLVSILWTLSVWGDFLPNISFSAAYFSRWAAICSFFCKFWKKWKKVLTRRNLYDIMSYVRFGGIAQLARASGSYPAGRRFKSHFRYQARSSSG